MTRKMKDSGIEWIGEIPEEWEIVQLKRFATVNNGREIENEVDASEYATPVFGSGGVFKYTDSYMYDGEAVMFGRKGTLGKPIYVNKRFWTVDTMYYLTYNQSLVAKYNYYQLLVFNWESHITQTALPSIVASEIVSCRFPIPPLDEQMYISSYLDTQCAKIDAVLEQTRQSIEEYKRLKQAVITRAVTKGIRPGRKMKDSGIEWIGEVPEEWAIQRIKNVSKINGRIGFRGYTTEDLVDKGEGAITLSPSNILGYKVIYDKCSYISWEKYEESPEIQVKNGDILFVKTGSSYGKSGIVEGLPLEASINPQLVVFKNISIDNHYFLFFLQTPSIKKEIEEIVSGGTIPTMGQEKMKNFHLCIPDSAEQKEIAEHLLKRCTEIDQIVSLKQKFIRNMEELKKSLIYECVTGKREV